MVEPLVMDWISDDELHSIGPEGVYKIVCQILRGEIKLSPSFKERVRQQKEMLGFTESVVYTNKKMEDREKILSEAYKILCKNGKVEQTRLSQATRDYFENLHDNIANGRWILLSGPSGWGKTISIEHLCWLDKGDHEILWCNAKDFQEWSCDKNNSMRQRMLNCPVLVLDNLDRFPRKEAGGSFKMELSVFDVVCHREANRKSTWITTRDRLGQLVDKFGEDVAKRVARACESSDCNFYNNLYGEELAL